MAPRLIPNMQMYTLCPRNVASAGRVHDLTGRHRQPGMIRLRFARTIQRHKDIGHLATIKWGHRVKLKHQPSRKPRSFSLRSTRDHLTFSTCQFYNICFFYAMLHTPRQISDHLRHDIGAMPTQLQAAAKYIIDHPAEFAHGPDTGDRRQDRGQHQCPGQIVPTPRLFWLRGAAPTLSPGPCDRYRAPPGPRLGGRSEKPGRLGQIAGGFCPKRDERGHPLAAPAGPGHRKTGIGVHNFGPPVLCHRNPRKLCPGLLLSLRRAHGASRHATGPATSGFRNRRPWWKQPTTTALWQ